MIGSTVQVLMSESKNKTKFKTVRGVYKLTENVEEYLRDIGATKIRDNIYEDETHYYTMLMMKVEGKLWLKDTSIC